jgi:hypothetical protein
MMVGSASNVRRLITFTGAHIQQESPMAPAAEAIRVPGITKLDELELRKKLDPSALRIEEDDGSSDIHGELATATAIVIVSLAALRVLAVYLVASHDGQEFEQTVEVERKNGEKRKTVIRYKSSSSKAPEAAVLEQLAAACDVDARELGKM